MAYNKYKGKRIRASDKSLDYPICSYFVPDSPGQRSASQKPNKRVLCLDTVKRMRQSGKNSGT
jgi:hypothetical protein